MLGRMDREQAARAIENFLRALGRDPDGEPALAGTGRPRRRRVRRRPAGRLFGRRRRARREERPARCLRAGDRARPPGDDDLSASPLAVGRSRHGGLRARFAADRGGGRRAPRRRAGAPARPARRGRRRRRGHAREAPRPALGGLPADPHARVHDRARRARARLARRDGRPPRTARPRGRPRRPGPSTSTRRCSPWESVVDLPVGSGRIVTLVGRVPLSSLRGGELVRLPTSRSTSSWRSSKEIPACRSP